MIRRICRGNWSVLHGYDLRDKTSIQSTKAEHQRDSARDGSIAPDSAQKCGDGKEPKYERAQPIRPQLGAYEGQLEQWLEQEAKFPRSRRRTARRLFEGLQEVGYQGAYDSVQRFVKDWKLKAQGPRVTQVFVPLVFEPADACQFDWSHEHVELGGVGQTVKVAHFRLAYSR
ncbi:hypothetical protein KMZ15_04885 [Mycoavidus sp. HKI]|uniref:hypothetical protein n=1 Tax=Mycoavidus sp. HKI TaxID=2840467 RepID=UPI001CC17EFC|nr:hypothetical protein [Mycoavidus sp. HKI]UAW63440.1 hypothetical protein KMZ15_04885 [Mycoavidus sp. HKI]